MLMLLDLFWHACEDVRKFMMSRNKISYYVQYYWLVFNGSQGWWQTYQHQLMQVMVSNSQNFNHINIVYIFENWAYELAYAYNSPFVIHVYVLYKINEQKSLDRSFWEDI